MVTLGVFRSRDRGAIDQVDGHARYAMDQSMGLHVPICVSSY
jgi:hypothetical protein